ncbi:MAG: hypothetical protein M3O46_08470, partial [Myxococcota bacterium]|nr:hypothetical protein [Myxococcota bacterium]
PTPAQNSIAPPPPRPFDPSHAHVDWSVTDTGGGATSAEVRRAFAHANGAWSACYRDSLRMSGQRVEGSGVLHVITDEIGNVVSAKLAGFSLPGVERCIASSSSVRIDGVDTGNAWADVRLVFRAGAPE